MDRDGTINVEKQYLYTISDFEFLPNAVEGLKLLQDAGFVLIILTNQSGIARGYYTERDYLKLTQWMLKQLEFRHIHISNVYYCPHHPNAKVINYRKKCDCRKPALGMFQRAINSFEIDLAQSFAVGDKIRDCAICSSTACRGFLIGNNESPKVLECVKAKGIPNIEYAGSLYEAALAITAMEA